MQFAIRILQMAFEKLIQVVKQIGLPINNSKLFSPTTELAILGITVNVEQRTFSIPPKKLEEISSICCDMLLRDQMSKRELQSLVSKLLYISRYVRGSRGCLNHMLQLLHDHHQLNRVILPREFQMDLLWFLKPINSFNGVVVFRRNPILAGHTCGCNSH